ncbi:MAG: replication protein RepA [Myxococcota bacterium]
MSPLLLHTALPHSNPGAGVSTAVRSNGNVRTTVQADPETGLPYGSYPRLVLAWITTEAVRTQCRRLVVGSSLSAFMRELGLSPTGGERGSITYLREQIDRLVATRVLVTVSSASKSSGLSVEVAQAWDVWWSPDRPASREIAAPTETASTESVIVLGERFFKEVTRNPFPIDLRILKALAKSPLGIDLYSWLTYRVSYLQRPVHIAWRQLHAQFGAGYTGDRGVVNFAAAAKRELRKIRVAWPALTYETPRGRLLLHPTVPSVAPRPLDP